MKNMIESFGLTAGIFQILFSLVCSQALAGKSDSNSDDQLPVRIPRPLLQKTFWGNLKIQFDDASLNLDVNSPVEWVQESTKLPGPLTGAQADFRDFRGCLNYKNLEGVALCFNVMPDVSSVGVNSSEMQLHGIGKFMTQQLSRIQQLDNCSYRAASLELVQASLDESTITIDFSGEVIPQAGCKIAPQALAIRFQLKPM